MEDNIENTELYQILKAKISPRQKGRRSHCPLDQVKVCAMIKTAADQMGAALDRACQNFPQYTMHDHGHAIRVVGLMGRLLDSEAKQRLNPIDIMLLILSAFGHDTGMAIGEGRLDETKRTQTYKRFLAERDDIVKRKERLHKDGNVAEVQKIDSALTREFLRLHHHEQSRALMETSQKSGGFRELLVIDSASLVSPTAMLCWSHGVPLDEVVRQPLTRFPFATVYESDLVFLACVLRLADYLEMDPGRAPSGLMEFFEISDPISLREWVKHQAATFSVTPHNIAVAAQFNNFDEEKAYRDTLKGLELERQQVMAYVASCPESPSRPRLNLHKPIDASQIQSNGYIYVEFRFSLEYRQIMKLLMGTRLYRDERVFVRELIQNAMDANRHATAAEEEATKSVPRVRSIEIRRSSAESKVIEFEDQGSGMTADIVQRYFMRVGQSYYQSAEFRLSHLKFRPVSQFGIGVLSCFMKANRVIVETKADPYVHPHADEAFREGVCIEIRGLDEFFVLKRHPRPVPGTLVRIELKEPLTESLESLVGRYLARSPFSVRIKDGDRVFNLPAPTWSVEGERFASMFLQTPDAFGYAASTLEFAQLFGFGIKGTMRFFVLSRNGRSYLRLQNAGPYRDVGFNEAGETVINMTSFDDEAARKYETVLKDIQNVGREISTHLEPILATFMSYTYELSACLRSRRVNRRTEALWEAVRGQVKVIQTHPSVMGHPGLVRLRERLEDLIQYIETFMSGELRKWPPDGICTQDGIDLTAQINLPTVLKLGIPFIYNVDLAGEHRFSLNVARDAMIMDGQSEAVVEYLHHRIGEFLGTWFAAERIPADQVHEYCEQAPPIFKQALLFAFERVNMPEVSSPGTRS